VISSDDDDAAELKNTEMVYLSERESGAAELS